MEFKRAQSINAARAGDEAPVLSLALLADSPPERRCGFAKILVLYTSVTVHLQFFVHVEIPKPPVLSAWYVLAEVLPGVASAARWEHTTITQPPHCPWTYRIFEPLRYDLCLNASLGFLISGIFLGVCALCSILGFRGKSDLRAARRFYQNPGTHLEKADCVQVEAMSVVKRHGKHGVRCQNSQCQHISILAKLEWFWNDCKIFRLTLTCTTHHNDLPRTLTRSVLGVRQLLLLSKF